MATIEEILQMPGVAAVGVFQPDGTVVDYKANMDMTPEMAGMSAQFCATVSMLFATLSGSFTQLSGMQWSPPQGWMFAGGEWTVAVAGDKGVFVRSDQADYNTLYAALIG